MTTSVELYKSLSDIKYKAYDAVRNLLKERIGDGSMNLHYYQVEDGTIRYEFLDIDRNGYGVGLHIDTIKFVDDDYEFVMCDTDDDDWAVRYLTDFGADESVWILEMLEEAFDTIDEVYDGKILKAGEFDYD